MENGILLSLLKISHEGAVINVESTENLVSYYELLFIHLQNGCNNRAKPIVLLKGLNEI